MDKKEMKQIDLTRSVRFFGRTVPSENGVFCNWSGSGFTFSFTGTNAYATFITHGEPSPDNTVYMGVFVDGSPFSSARFPIKKSGGVYPLAERLPYGKHTVRVVRETEIYYGFTALAALQADGEADTVPPAPALRLEFIGDSLTCGHGNISSCANPEFTTAEENFSDTFAAQTAALLHAQLSVVAASGNGFAHHYGCETGNLIPDLYGYTDKLFADARGVPPETWDFIKDPCDAVVVKLGQNDGRYCSGTDLKPENATQDVLARRREEFTFAARRFLETVSQNRPGTPIVLIYEEDMLLKDDLCRAAKPLPLIHFLEILPKREYEGVGANGHFSRFTHARVAGLLTHKLSSIIGSIV